MNEKIAILLCIVILHIVAGSLLYKINTIDDVVNCIVFTLEKQNERIILNHNSIREVSATNVEFLKSIETTNRNLKVGDEYK